MDDCEKHLTSPTIIQYLDQMGGSQNPNPNFDDTDSINQKEKTPQMLLINKGVLKRPSFLNAVFFGLPLKQLNVAPIFL